MINSGFINLLKPTGMTSNDAVAKIRGMIKRSYGEKVKVGHTGTLDPNAAGVMLLGIGNGTKFTQYVLDKNKTYVAVLSFGKRTSTLDSYGETEEIREVKSFDKEEVQRILATFEGKSFQIPPKFSAIQINGQRLYQLARAGKEIPTIQPREIEIPDIQLLDMGIDWIKIQVECSSGTYIRSLALDIGEAMGNLGTLALLIRTKLSKYRIEDSITMEEIQELIERQALQEKIIPTDQVLDKYPTLALQGGEKLYLNGAAISTQRYIGSSPSEGKYRVYDRQGRFLGVGRMDINNMTIKSETMAR